LKKQADTFPRIGLVANTSKPLCRTIIQRAAALIAKSGRQVAADEATARFASLDVVIHKDTVALSRKTDLLLVAGGDGTILSTARNSAGSPHMIGINAGRLGFLTTITHKKLPEALEKIWAGKYSVEDRGLIQLESTLGGKPLKAQAMNDFVVARGQESRLIELEVRVDGEPLTHYRCDGMIVSSPTGSTAYSLAAGGALVSPHAKVFMLTPICPHTLSNRSLILSLDSEIEIQLLSRKPETNVSADGIILAPMQPGDCVKIRRSRRTIKLLQIEGESFFRTLRSKLDWSGAHG
jgi:NAD+ kinase